ncbi:hypothetical protein [Dietzia aurantiaca]|uniref:Uncharacterized protein n=1 Tax=Dietzia aurantiaca TaxID=983873 RepID=A0ABV9PN87_9ACTN
MSGRAPVAAVLAAIVGAFALALSMLLSGAGTAVAQGAGEPAPAQGIFEFSADGITWSEDPSAVLPPFGGGNLSPGRVIERQYYVRNADSVPGTFETFIGDWSSSANSLFTVQSDFGDDVGVRYTYYGQDFPEHTYGPAVEVGTVLNSVELAPGEQVQIVDGVGLHPDAGKETQGARVTTAIEWRLTVPEPEPEPEPEPGECEGGIPASGLFSAAGSTGSESTGSVVGSTAGSAGSASLDGGCTAES